MALLAVDEALRNLVSVGASIERAALSTTSPGERSIHPRDSVDW